jgi:hypothetical protein
MVERNQTSAVFNNWEHHVNGAKQKDCAVAFVNYLRENGIYAWVLSVFDEAHVDPDGLGYGGLRGYLRFTEPENFVKNLHKNPPAEFADLDVLWQEILTFLG